MSEIALRGKAEHHLLSARQPRSVALTRGPVEVRARMTGTRQSQTQPTGWR